MTAHLPITRTGGRVFTSADRQQQAESLDDGIFVGQRAPLTMAPNFDLSDLMVGATAAANIEDDGFVTLRAMVRANPDAPAPTEGRKDDGGKVQIELVPSELIFAVATILTFGAGKYAPRNWEKGMSWGRVFGALMRHMWCWWAGKGPTTESFVFGSTDDETGHSHLWHAACCLTFLIAYEQRGIGTDDRAGAAQ